MKIICWTITPKSCWSPSTTYNIRIKLQQNYRFGLGKKKYRSAKLRHFALIYYINNKNIKPKGNRNQDSWVKEALNNH